MDIKRYLQRLGVDGGGIDILQSKAKLHLIEISDLHVGAANILKQDALSVGADLAVPRGTVIAKTPKVDVLLIASTRALQKLSKKELAQPFGLKEVAKKLQAIVQVKRNKSVELMGVINANDDSFFSGSRFHGVGAFEKIVQMIEDGASIIDIGAVSSRPNAEEVELQEELSRLIPIVDLIEKEKLYDKAVFSIDSYQPEAIAYALERGFRIVNDITGLADDRVCEVAARHRAQVVIMHMQGNPQTMQKDPYYDNILDEVSMFFQERIEKADRYGIEDIVLDVGIGFGKTVEHNLLLVKNLEHFLTLQKPLLVGASRKSMIDKITPARVEDRLAGTLALHLEAYRNGASILRVHDVFEHTQALRVQEALETTL
jgi:dihydropteroate synthase